MTTANLPAAQAQVTPAPARCAYGFARTLLAAPELRFERKFRLAGHERQLLEAWIRLQPGCFRERYAPRPINNVYFDTVDFAHYRAHVDGEALRRKLRIRWYGDLMGTAARPVLELKCRRAALGHKIAAELAPLALAGGYRAAAIAQCLTHSKLSPEFREMLLHAEPRLINRYRRRYFQSACGRIRMTVDAALEYFRVPSSDHPGLTTPVSEPGIVILEVKYSEGDERDAARVLSAVPFPLTRNSKYVTGVELIYGD